MKRLREVYEIDNGLSDPILIKDLWVLVIWEGNPVKKEIDEEWGLSTKNKTQFIKYLVFFKRISKSFTLLFNEIMEELYLRIFDAFLDGRRIEVFRERLKKFPKETRELAKEYIQNEIEIRKCDYIKNINFNILCHFAPPRCNIHIGINCVINKFIIFFINK